MLGKGLVKKLSAAFVVAGCAFVAVVALGATLYYALALVLPPLGAAAITAGAFALVAVIVAMVFLGVGGAFEEEAEEEPEGLGGRAYALFRSRPILGTVAALAGGWIFLRNPALATMVAAAFTEKSHGRYRR
ncbi:hypothetical protein MMB232_00248 [Brevundimonas subvibrioides]|uniref:Uncharacterized protein n=1 Tax=Brevundimonas subvibrioides (strain ATCC 15264 / DSM 4735 / LMG 14903 / NBRC 16000 / CB 81) TaxID=633149 RepID=D9QJ87_BRESC|nr:hypothetical protein [Brevundimonas subvibrioides]ADK99611.1 conserved hypothetical protein [Brevundimonas subvibrioides ATCC 15264]